MNIRPILTVLTSLIPVQSQSLTKKNLRTPVKIPEAKRLEGPDLDPLIGLSDPELRDEQLSDRKLNKSINNDAEPSLDANAKDEDNIPNDLSKISQLVEAIENNDAISFTQLIGEVEDLNTHLLSGKAPIHYAVESNNGSFVAMLCAAGADCNLRCEASGFDRFDELDDGITDQTPIEIAVDLRLDGMFDLLLKEVGVHTRPDKDDTLLHYIVTEGGTKDMVRSLVQGGLPIDSQDEHGRTALHDAAFSSLGIEAVKELLILGAKTDAKDFRGRTPLHDAVDEEHIALTKELLEYGANTDIRDNTGRTALHYAASKEKDYSDIVKELLVHGADPNIKDNIGDTPLFYAVERGSLDALKELLKYGAKADIINKDGKTPLHFAEWEDYLEAVKELLKYGAKTDVRDSNGKTPLHYAIYNEKGSSDVAKELLVHGADPNIKDNVGNTPLFYAVQKGSFGVVKELLKYGFKVDIKNNEGKNPLYYAKNEEMKVLLRNGQKQQSIRDKGNDFILGLKEGSLGTLGTILLVGLLAFLYRKVRKSQNQLNLDQSEPETMGLELNEMNKSL